jgi:hypothetical protein
MNNYFETIRDTFNSYRETPNVEFEIRLGKIHDKGFDTNVSAEVFTKIMKGLKKYQEWEEIKVTDVDVFYYFNNIRYTLDENNNKSETIQKNTLTKIDYRIDEQPFDIRFSVANEIPMGSECPNQSNPTRMIKKYRESFIRKNLSIDMTIVTGEQIDLDTEDEQVYQIEFEIIDPSKVKTDNELYAHCHKIKCVLDLM